MRFPRASTRVLVLVSLLVAGSLLATYAQASSGKQPFGGKQDVAFAQQLWQAMDDYQDWPMRSEVYPGTSPHGAFLRLYYGLVTIDGKAYHVIVKDNFGGADADAESVSADPEAYLAAVTVMVQREEGYAPDAANWFWVKYRPDGSLDTNARDMKLAGRVAKGSDQGCIACHTRAGGGDYVFTNDQP